MNVQQPESGMRTSYILFVGMLLVSIASFVGSHSHDITSFRGLFFDVQHLFGLLGVVGAVLGAWVAKSPASQGDGKPPESKP